ncbi:MAG: hypothetical protein JXR70_08185 [Spirochaetales bacterium]|nr:hypothetical protein [Spirochaetales bacterium]
MVEHHQLALWEKKLKILFDEIDDFLENKYGQEFPLQPNRPKRGATSSKNHDGLFNVGAAFSGGYGSEHGAGYVIEIRMSTLAHVPDELRNTIGLEVKDLVEEKLQEQFPGKDLKVAKDGFVYKIYGDLTLGFA